MKMLEIEKETNRKLHNQLNKIVRSARKQII